MHKHPRHVTESEHTNLILELFAGGQLRRILQSVVIIHGFKVGIKLDVLVIVVNFAVHALLLLQQGLFRTHLSPLTTYRLL